ncbi:FadR/GntR family transcriptional regulator [Aliiglaciecola sp. 3_MG-2023]|uniref:FadR/GntR family transcriptional regulator n=1 Tax=Aliiglaciecola sp. 3_MG-2023 TaxID=3062644 RepID=UPI0026E47A92|nr:FadR/GntR family transcriptional regulator [Aliiglaciecola sp. 3_MG-2023]MDO6693213.1 FadR/GntR family transcriptional regulator [Aliiglaciecola sp. 3_MG-2023]
MKNRRMFWQIVEKIEALIDSGKYPPGSRLPPERELAETFNVSRPTIREAIIALEVRERVDVKTSSGVYVLENPQTDEPEIKVSAFELTQARALVEGEAAALAAASITEQELADLEGTLVAMEKGVHPEKADREFHLIISKATRNNAVCLAVEKFWQLRDSEPDIVNVYKNVCNRSDSDRLEEHRKIYTALKNHDSAEARQAMHYHFNRLINTLFEISEAKALEEVRKQSTQTRDLYSLNHLVE